jgi:hypothetical protein
MITIIVLLINYLIESRLELGQSGQFENMNQLTYNCTNDNIKQLQLYKTFVIVFATLFKSLFESQIFVAKNSFY